MESSNEGEMQQSCMEGTVHYFFGSKQPLDIQNDCIFVHQLSMEATSMTLVIVIILTVDVFYTTLLKTFAHICTISL
jgi:hypothetical protein